jgi:4-hydroxybenzoate polyprenyltransferase
MLTGLIRSMRPKQWPKNAFIFAALVFDRQLLHIGPLLRVTAGFFILILASGAVYIWNDIADVENDRQHPTKRRRPIASGQVPIPTARGASAFLAALSLALAFLLDLRFGLIVLTYVIINVLYSGLLKHVPIIDVFLVAAGFLLRVGAGVALITVERFSPWLYVCTTLLSLFIGFGKRRAEISLLMENAKNHRRVLDGYTIPFLDQLIVIVSSTTIIAYSLYTFSAENLPVNHTMMLTIPFVLYGIFRYLHLIHVEGAGGAPEEVVLSDRPLIATVVLWGVTAVGILYLGT